MSDVQTDDRIPSEAYRPDAVKSLLVVPVGTPVTVGAIGVYWRKPHRIGELEQVAMRALARAGSLSIAALRRHDLTNQTDAWLGMALRVGGFGVWSQDLVSGELNISETCKTIFGYPADAPVTAADLRATIHPEDHSLLRATFDEGDAATGQDMYAEFRVIWPDGTVHWVAQRGRVVS